MERKTIIPKDCFVCDSCNKGCSDSNFIATEHCFWYEGWLYCDDCDKKYKPGSYKDSKLVRVIAKGDDLSKTELALPIVMEFGNSQDGFFEKFLGKNKNE